MSGCDGGGAFHLCIPRLHDETARHPKTNTKSSLTDFKSNRWMTHFKIRTAQISPLLTNPRVITQLKKTISRPSLVIPQESCGLFVSFRPPIRASHELFCLKVGG